VAQAKQVADVVFELVNEDGTPKLPNSFDEDDDPAIRALDDSERDALIEEQRVALGAARSVITSCRLDRFRVTALEMHRVIYSLALPAKPKGSKSSKKQKS